MAAYPSLALKQTPIQSSKPKKATIMTDSFRRPATVTALEERLRVLHERTRATPLFNPVFQLAHELSGMLESGEMALEDFERLIAELENQSLGARAEKLRFLVSPGSSEERLEALSLDGGAFEAWQARWAHPHMHVVFTAHPTFLLTPAQSEAVAGAASGGGKVAHVALETRPPITLDSEHAAAMTALANAQDARDRIVDRALDCAAREWPDRWRAMQPEPFRFATWVGYDMDGRTDIKWYTSIRFRLSEKAQRLARYAERLAAIDGEHALLDILRAAQARTYRSMEDFSGDLSDPAKLSAAANRLTDAGADKLLSLTPLIEQLETEASEAEPRRARALKTLAAAMRADGLGMGWVHFRVNAKQLHNAIRSHMENGDEIDLGSRGALAALRSLLEGVEPLGANFGSLAVESSTAVRQFLAMTQILKHIDADTPIRMLIAECEQPATALSALYFARLFGIADKIDISPPLRDRNRARTWRSFSRRAARRG